MKKIIFLVVLFYAMTFGQGWNSTVTTTISESTLQKMDQFTNKNGNHLLIKKSNGNIVYYNLNSQGTVDNNKTATLESNGDFPTITGNNDIVYAFYKAGSYIKLKYTTNGGTSWTYNSNLDLSIGSNECNGVDAVYELVQGVHLVWATKDSEPYFETYYYRLTPYPNPSWADYKNVTDYTGFQYGSRPTVAFSDNRVHVSFGPVSGLAVGDVSTRDRYNGSWQTPQNASGSDYSSVEKLITSGNYIYMIYSQSVPPSYFDLAYKVRTLSGTWSSGSGTDIVTNIIGTEYTFDICKTYDNKLQLVYEINDGQYQDLLHRSYDGSWSSTFTVDNNQYFAGNPKGISSTSNDFFVIWKRQSSNSLFYRQYDNYPLAPQNLSVTSRDFGQWSHPVLAWSFNNEPDVFIYIYGYEVQRRTRTVPGNFGNWSTIAYTRGDVNSYNDYDIIIEGTGTIYQAEYRIRAIDVGNKASGWSSTVSIYFGQFGKMNNGMQRFEYQLSQNHPNPFNPATTIEYSVGSTGLVTLKVYDMLGTEVASLVNEHKEAGSYSVEFNAADLPSGIYFYTLTSGNFMETKKLILLK
ncbi:MAG TPA: T9SS type A sorting domain-containing protein [Ignavibacteriaceae bacterium]|nr:T9SS type A sorting domain-containing protein [Ignavibacteriaceae bacterium]